MSDNPFYTYQKFQDKLGAIELSEFLNKHDIEFILTESSPDLNLTFNDLNKEFLIKIKKEDFERADDIQFKVLSNSLDTISKDYYLFGFTNEELTEVIVKNEEWSKLDFVLAQKILKTKGKEIDPTLLRQAQNQKSKEVEKLEKERNGLAIREKKGASKNMVYGALWVAGGIIATLASDIEYLFWGAILFGALQFIKGAMNK